MDLPRSPGCPGARGTDHRNQACPIAEAPPAPGAGSPEPAYPIAGIPPTPGGTTRSPSRVQAEESGRNSREPAHKTNPNPPPRPSFAHPDAPTHPSHRQPPATRPGMGATCTNSRNRTLKTRANRPPGSSFPSRRARNHPQDRNSHPRPSGARQRDELSAARQPNQCKTPTRPDFCPPTRMHQPPWLPTPPHSAPTRERTGPTPVIRSRAPGALR